MASVSSPDAGRPQPGNDSEEASFLTPVADAGGQTKKRPTTVFGCLLATAMIVVIGIRLVRIYQLVREARATDGAPTSFDWYAVKPSDKIHWTDCYDGHKCARLNLPLDYLAPSDDRKTAIALRLVPAKDKKNYKGTILVNPGGPGASGTGFIEHAGANISRIVGDSFDILGFDPRGIGASTPRAECFDDEMQRQQWRYGRDGRLLNPTDGSLPLIRAKERMTTRRRESTIGGPEGIGRFMNTASVARDMLEITQQLGQEKLQYWGFGYGSVLGQYFSAIYPERVGRVIIDGVYDSHNYRAGLWNSNLEDMDKVVSGFYEFCHQEGPDKCAIYASSPSEIEARFLAALAELEENPVAIPKSAAGPTIFTANNLLGLMFQATYKPLASFSTVADAVAAIEDGDVTALAELSGLVNLLESNHDPPEPWSISTDAFYSIACGDADPVTYSPEEYARYYRDLERSSPFAAPIWGIHYLQCSEWSVRPTWRYTGTLGAANTAHPLLVLAPRFDPVCPLSNGRKVAARYGGARVLVQNSYGHCSLAAPSLCTAKYVRAYFENGTLPEEGTVCEVDELPFVGRTTGAQAMSVGDREILDAMRGAGEHLHALGHF